MECRTLDLTIISAEGLKSIISKYDVYVVVHGTDGRELQITPVLRNAGSSDQLTWNFPMKFTIDEAEGLKDSLNLKIMGVNWLIRKTLGKVRVPIKDLMKDIKDEGKESQLVTYPVVNRKAEPGASLTFSYEFGKKFLHKVEVPYTKSDSKLEESRSFMECRTLDLTIISAGGLKSISKYDVYVAVRGTGGRKLHITPVLRNAGSSDQLTWNFPMKFTIDEAEGLEDRLNLVIKIMAVNWLIRKTWGKVRVPIKDLMKDIKDEGKESQLVTYPAVNRKAEPGASLTFSYEFGKKFLHKVEVPYTKSDSKLEKSRSFMECRTLDLTIISAGGLKSISKYDVYIVVRGTGGRKLQTTPVLRNAGSSEQHTWNFPTKFTIDEAEGLEDRLNLVIKIMVVNWLIRKTWGKVRVPIKDLMKDIKDEGKESQVVTYPVVNRKGASLTFSYEFGKKFLHEVKAPYTKPGSKLLESGPEFGEILTSVVEVAYGGGCGCGGGGCGGGCGCGGGGCGGGCGG